MSLAGDLARVDQYVPVKGPQCTVCRALLSMPPEDADALRASLAGPAMTTAIAQIVRANGYRIATGTLQRHRNGLCRGDA